MVDVWFIRHGETISNAGEATKNAYDIYLTERGHEQARQISTLIDKTPDLIVMSAYLRTHQTAQPTRDKFPDVPHTIWPVHEFNYLSDSKYDGKTANQRQPFRDAFWATQDPQHTDGQNCESFSSLLSRARETVELVKQQKDGFIVVFSHAIFLHALRTVVAEPHKDDASLMKDFLKVYHANPVDNGAIFRVKADEAGLAWFDADTRKIQPANKPRFDY